MAARPTRRASARSVSGSTPRSKTKRRRCSRFRLTILLLDDARHPGGVNIFGKGFGNHDQDIVMRLFLDTETKAEQR
jgi:predicted transcriptional regulator